jgi:hypothetical protein
MATMTDKESDALDELSTKTTPKIRVGEGGFFTRQRNLLNALDPVAANYIRSPSEIIGDLVREKIDHEAEAVMLGH